MLNPSSTVEMDYQYQQPSPLLADRVTSLHAAVIQNDAETVRRLHAAGTLVVDEQDETGNTALAVAADAGHAEMIQLLHSLGAKINTVNREGRTPLDIAASRRHLACIRLLHDLGSGVDRNSDRKRRQKLLLQALANNDIELAQLWVTLGADIDFTSGFLNHTPLHIAASSGDLDRIRILHTLGADLHRADDLGDTPLSVAVRSGRLDAVVELTNLGSDVNATDETGCTALFHAATRLNAGGVRLLLSLGADRDASNMIGETALMAAAVGMETRRLWWDNCRACLRLLRDESYL